MNIYGLPITAEVYFLGKHTNEEYRQKKNFLLELVENCQGTVSIFNHRKTDIRAGFESQSKAIEFLSKCNHQVEDIQATMVDKKRKRRHMDKYA